MPEREHAPCQERPTPCQSIYEKRGGVLPCPLYEMMMCRPTNSFEEKVKTGLPGKIAEAELRVDLHEACPVSTVFLSPVNDTEREVAASFREKMGEPIS